jgi:hypothetical protein
MKSRYVLASLLAFALCASVHAADKPCSKADAATAEKAIDRVVNWGQLHKAYVDYRHCDADAVGEVYTDALLRLAVEWKNVPAFADAMNKDAGFKEFVHKHLLSPAAKDDRESVYSRAKSSCPKGMDAFCADLAAVVKAEAKPGAIDVMKPIEMMRPIESAKPAPK